MSVPRSCSAGDSNTSQLHPFLFNVYFLLHVLCRRSLPSRRPSHPYRNNCQCQWTRIFQLIGYASVHNGISQPASKDSYMFLIRGLSLDGLSCCTVHCSPDQCGWGCRIWPWTSCVSTQGCGFVSVPRSCPVRDSNSSGCESSLFNVHHQLYVLCRRSLRPLRPSQPCRRRCQK